jgi:two-component system nitrate/nitrite response regulator NarL
MRTARPRRVVVADDHPIVLAGVLTLLKAARAYQVVATASNGADALAQINRLAPDLAVLDINMPEKSGIDVLRELQSAEEPTTRVVLLTASVQDAQIASAVACGTWGIIRKDAAADELVSCLDQVSAGERWLPDGMVAPALERELARQSESAKYASILTPREQEVAALVADGLSNKHISRRTGIAEGTVKIHLHNIYQKLNVANRTALATVAQRYWRKSDETEA